MRTEPWNAQLSSRPGDRGPVGNAAQDGRDGLCPVADCMYPVREQKGDVVIVFAVGARGW